MKLGIICPSEIALRRFMPALQFFSDIEFAGVAICTRDERFDEASNVDEKRQTEIIQLQRKKAQVFIDNYGGTIFEGYNAICTSDRVDMLYVPLPPGLHYKWAKKALAAGKHVMLEKPSTACWKETQKLIQIAQNKGLALHENYMFMYHSQITEIDKIIQSGELGMIRLCRISFGFPMRKVNDFRYIKELGGGALLDAGGYTLKYARHLLGSTARIAYAQLNELAGFEVDMYGSGVLVNTSGMTVQIAFGMDNDYKCELEVWGSKACLKAYRVLTAPSGLKPFIVIKKNSEEEVRTLSADDSFRKSIGHFLRCIENRDVRINNYEAINDQALLVEKFYQMSKKQ